VRRYRAGPWQGRVGLCAREARPKKPAGVLEGVPVGGHVASDLEHMGKVVSVSGGYGFDGWRCEICDEYEMKWWWWSVEFCLSGERGNRGRITRRDGRTSIFEHL